MSSGELDVQIQHDSAITSARAVLTPAVLDALGRPEPRAAVAALVESLLEEVPADRIHALIRFDEPSRRRNTVVARAARRLASAPPGVRADAGAA